MPKADSAYANAERRRVVLLNELERVEAQANTIRKQIEDVDRFLSEWRQYAGVTVADDVPSPSSTDTSLKAAPTRRGPRSNNPDKEIIGDEVQRMLEEFQRPMSRQRIFTELEQRGFKLEGSDPPMVLSTMLWRMKHRFVRIPGKGYWFAGKPVPDLIGDTEHASEEERAA
jgi:hypothetical protein